MTQQEMACVERVTLGSQSYRRAPQLASLGFPPQTALEAYLACDQNEELAINFLLEHGFDDEDLGGGAH